MQFCNHFYSHLIINVLSSWWPLHHSSWRTETNQWQNKLIFFLQIIYLCPFRNGEPDFLYARSWLPWFFFSGVVTFGSIGRQLAMVCFCSWSEPHFSSKILFTLERNGANTVPIRSDDTNVPYRLCNFKALEQA